MGIPVPRTHVCIQSSIDVRQIAAPLFQYTNIHYFCYGRNYPNGGTFTLHTDVNFYDSWFIQEFPLVLSFLKEGLHLWDDCQNADLIRVRLNDFNYGNGLYIVRHFPEYSEIFGFAPAREQNISDLYLNNLDVLNRFAMYFKDKAYRIIERAEKDLIFVPKTMLIEKEELASNNNLELLRNTTKIEMYALSPTLNLELTQREHESFKGFLQGQTAAQIASSLNLSPKSVETFLLKVKKKFQCSTRSDLLKRAWDLGILQSNGWFD
ncbi:MAG TPA: helix-turn-helix transcriptional regulator [Gammaproteobacteria bacterium]|nr:helix-turn-helix transcriptional regulator [Gammaproteobacteria bacterium]